MYTVQYFGTVLCACVQSELLRELCELIRDADGDFKRVCSN